MKRIATILLMTILLISCSNDKENGADTALESQWVLTDVFCFCAFGDNPDFSGHKITFEANVLSVVNSGEFSFLTNASGSYTLVDHLITLNNGSQYTYVIEGASLKLTFVDEPGIADDEVLLVYVRS